ncbi:1-deoxy-D-xylulose-5-phosphate reductoisomerase [Brevibacterium samyangense]
MNDRLLIVMGATGSVGTQTLDLVYDNPERFRVVGLTAGSNVALVTEQAILTGARVLGIHTPPAGGEAEVRDALAEHARRLGMPDTVEDIHLGPGAGDTVAAYPADIVLNAVTGAVGLTGTLAALEAGTDVALANKESLIVGGPVVLDAAARNGARLIPVDSEHSAIAQALRSGREAEVRRLVVTASGGPFLGMSRAELAEVTPAQALVHPTWNMGTVITTNSASLVNKGLEVIEAHYLFGTDYDDIQVVVHPQSQIHSMVEFVDGSTIAQVSPPDMRLPIAYALGLGDRIPGATTPNDWTQAATWTFEPVDDEAFPALSLAYRAGRAGGTYPAVYNAANEVLVEAFHAGRVRFTEIADGIAAALDAHEELGEVTLESVLAADAAARAHTATRIANRSDAPA